MIHGKRSTYRKGCRCDPCIIANRRYARNYNRLKRGIDPYDFKHNALREEDELILLEEAERESSVEAG